MRDMSNNNLLIFIIVALLILGAVYYFTMPPKQPDVPMDTYSTNDDTSVEVLEQELGSADLENLDQEFADIETELNAAVSEAQ